MRQLTDWTLQSRSPRTARGVFCCPGCKTPLCRVLSLADAGRYTWVCLQSATLALRFLPERNHQRDALLGVGDLLPYCYSDGFPRYVPCPSLRFLAALGDEHQVYSLHINRPKSRFLNIGTPFACAHACWRGHRAGKWLSISRQTKVYASYRVFTRHDWVSRGSNLAVAGEGVESI